MSLSTPETIALRAYTEKPNAKPVSKRNRRKGLDEASPWVLIFDTETRIDPSQALRVGFYQLRYDGELIKEGAFYDADVLDADDQSVLKEYCSERDLGLLKVGAFNEQVFLEYGYAHNAVIVGMNLGFDLSRIAIHHGPARGSMRGGFSFQFSKSRHQPRVQVKHLSRKASLIQFSAPWREETPRGMRKHGLKTPRHSGFFTDVKTLAASILSHSHSLESLCDALGVATLKKAIEEHGGPLTPEYLNYAREDVQATWECYAALIERYEQHALSTPAHRIMSEASIGKAYLKEMGVDPLLACQDVPRELFGKIMSTFYGGRAEVRIRRIKTEVIYTDFKSMYPTVNALMGLWKYVIADGFTWQDATAEARAFLERISPTDFQKSTTWKALTTLVKVRPEKDVLPVRAKYDGKVNTIGLNYLSYEGGLWYTLADVVAAKILSGKAPSILEAIRFVPGERQSGLQPIQLFGNPDYHIDPNEDDAFTRMIDLRDEAKARKDPHQVAIKILANSTSYGIFIEVLRDNAPKPEALMVYGPEGALGDAQSTALEEPGKFFHPLLGTLITGAARLMLALAETEAKSQGLGWVFCDTDSLALARPPEMSRADFRTRAKRVTEWFVPLNPYRKPGSILQMEDVNFAADNSSNLEPLNALAISSKRYALFNIDTHNRPVIRKASAHGLGHLVAPWDERNPAPDVPAPVTSLTAIGVSRWHYDFWYHIILAALNGHPDHVPLDFHPSLTQPAASRYGATSPDLLAWMRHHNEDREYADQVKPFGFMTSFSALPTSQRPMTEDFTADPTKRGRPKKQATPKPIAPFERNPAKAATQAFDRETGETVPVELLQTCQDALVRYPHSPESKFENADYFDRGEARRRHVVATHVELIGKEANGVGEFGEAEDPTMLTNAVYES